MGSVDDIIDFLPSGGYSQKATDRNSKTKN